MLGLATSWRLDAEDRRTWVFSLRPCGRFHDGSPFDAVVCGRNFASVLDQGAPQFDALHEGQVDVVESVPPDTIATRRAAGLRMVMNADLHVRARRLSMLPDSPFRDVRV